MNLRLLIIINDPDFFISHRLPIAIEARNRGVEVHIATASGESVKEITKLGFIHHCIPISRSGKSPIREFSTIVTLWRVIREVTPDVLHLVTIKPVLYGGIIARLAKVPAVVAAISGMGGVFVADSVKARVLRFFVGILYKLALSHKNINVIFQNSDDKTVVQRITGLKEKQTSMIRGSGVNLDEYFVTDEPEGEQVVIFAARLLKDKGIYEFIHAAEILRRRGLNIRFLVAGSVDPGNPSTVSQADVQRWSEKNSIEVLGYRKDIPEVFRRSTLIVLPSYYREGLPKVLIEAAACGKPVITTDSPGCRDAIEENVTGLLVPPRDAAALANAIEKILKDDDLRHSMGRAGRLLAENSFDIRQVVFAHLSIYEKLLNQVA